MNVFSINGPTITILLRLTSRLHLIRERRLTNHYRIARNLPQRRRTRRIKEPRRILKITLLRITQHPSRRSLTLTHFKLNLIRRRRTTKRIITVRRLTKRRSSNLSRINLSRTPTGRMFNVNLLILTILFLNLLKLTARRRTLQRRRRTLTASTNIKINVFRQLNGLLRPNPITITHKQRTRTRTPMLITHQRHIIPPILRERKQIRSSTIRLLRTILNHRVPQVA